MSSSENMEQRLTETSQVESPPEEEQKQDQQEQQYSKLMPHIFSLSGGVQWHKKDKTKHFFNGKAWKEWVGLNKKRMEKYFPEQSELEAIKKLIEAKCIGEAGQNDQKDLEKMEFYYYRKRRVIVIGGGWAGRKLARGLDKSVSGALDITLINETPYFDSKTALPYVMVDIKKLNKFRRPLTQYIKKGKVIVDKVVAIEDNGSIKLEKGPAIKADEYDVLVFASGSDYNLNLLNPDKASIPIVKGLDIEDVLNRMKDIEAAKDITVIGGGPVAIEIAGELMVKYPKKHINIISGRKEFMERSAITGAHKSCAKVFNKAKNVTCIMGRHVSRIEDNICYMSENPSEQVQTDLVIACIGFRARAYYLQKYQNGKILNRFGQIKVNPCLQVEGHPNWFVIGDCSDVKEEKLAGNAHRTADNAQLNINKLLKQGPKSQLRPYKIEYVPMLISIGPKTSILVKNNKVMMNNFIMSYLKNYLEGYFMA